MTRVCVCVQETEEGGGGDKEKEARRRRRRGEDLCSEVEIHKIQLIQHPGDFFSLFDTLYNRTGAIFKNMSH